MSEIPQECLEQLAETVPYMTYVDSDLPRLLSAIACPDLLDMDDFDAALD